MVILPVPSNILNNIGDNPVVTAFLVLGIYHSTPILLLETHKKYLIHVHTHKSVSQSLFYELLVLGLL